MATVSHWLERSRWTCRGPTRTSLSTSCTLCEFQQQMCNKAQWCRWDIMIIKTHFQILSRSHVPWTPRQDPFVFHQRKSRPLAAQHFSLRRVAGCKWLIRSSKEQQITDPVVWLYSCFSVWWFCNRKRRTLNGSELWTISAPSPSSTTWLRLLSCSMRTTIRFLFHFL